MYKIDQGKCNACGNCILVCPRNIIQIDDFAIITKQELCLKCGHCYGICPQSAISYNNIFPNEDDSIAENSIDSSNFFKFLAGKRSIREYSDDVISKKDLEKLLEVAKYAPTGKNDQDNEFVVITGRKEVQSLSNDIIIEIEKWIKKINSPITYIGAKITRQSKKYQKARKNLLGLKGLVKQMKKGNDKLFFNAPLVLIFHSPMSSRTPRENCLIAATYVSLLAETMNIGSCFIHYFVEIVAYSKEIREKLHIPKNHKIYTTLALGIPKVKYKRIVPRKDRKVTILPNNS